MRIQLYDKGTPKGKQLFATLDTLCKRMQIDYDPEYIKDMNKVYSMGIQGNTVVLIDGEVALVDKYLNAKDLEAIISDFRK